MPESMGIKSLWVLLLTLLPLYICKGQDFGISYGKLSKEDFQYRNFKRSIHVIDENGVSLIRSEPIYEDLRFEKGEDYLAACIPIVSLDSLNQRRLTPKIWICFDKDLNPVFTFPLYTKDVQLDTTLQMFLFTDLTSVFSGHWYRMGAIDFTGQVILKPDYAVITRKDCIIFALKEGSYEEDTIAYDRTFVVYDLINNKEYCFLLKDLNIFSHKIDSTQLNLFEAAWDSVMDQDLENAIAIYREVSLGSKSHIKKAARYKIKELKKISRLLHRLPQCE